MSIHQINPESLRPPSKVQANPSGIIRPSHSPPQPPIPNVQQIFYQQHELQPHPICAQPQQVWAQQHEILQQIYQAPQQQDNFPHQYAGAVGGHHGNPYAHPPQAAVNMTLHDTYCKLISRGIPAFDGRGRREDTHLDLKRLIAAKRQKRQPSTINTDRSAEE